MLPDASLWTVVTFFVFLLLFVGVGVLSARRKRDTTTDYLVASRSVNPWMTALSAMASGQSGFLFTGQVGLAYATGISAVWLVIGWQIGDYLAWWLFFRRFRRASEAAEADTVSSFLAGRGRGAYAVALLSGVITVVFLSTYAAAQMVAGSKALKALLDIPYTYGIVGGTAIVVLYCFAGGIRASIWTDTLQGLLMIGSLLVLLGVAVDATGGVGAFWARLSAIDADLTRLSPSSLPYGFLPYFLGWVGAGFGVIGQPHILVRVMAIESPDKIIPSLNLKTVATLANAFAAIGIGMAARVLLPDLGATFDRELALPALSLELLPALLVGMMLAGLFAATVSTADSQVLSSSAAITQDIFPQLARDYRWAKVGTLAVAAAVTAIALGGSQSVFGLVTFAWSVLAGGLGPLLVVRALGQPVSPGAALATMLAGLGVAIGWKLSPALSGFLYEALPSMVAGALVYLSWRRTPSGKRAVSSASDKASAGGAAPLV